jgi:hypothetical protein
MAALASYHRGHPEVEVDRLKQAAFQNLHLSDSPDMPDIVEHIAANLLLCVVEVCSTHTEDCALLIQCRCSRQLQGVHAGLAIFVV